MRERCRALGGRGMGIYGIRRLAGDICTVIYMSICGELYCAYVCTPRWRAVGE